MKSEFIIGAALPDVAEVRWCTRCPLLSLCSDVAANPTLSPTGRPARVVASVAPEHAEQTAQFPSRHLPATPGLYRRCQMDQVYRCCAGLDVHKKTVCVCIRVDGKELTETFGTSTRELLALG